MRTLITGACFLILQVSPAQFHDELIDPVVNAHVGIMPLKIRGIGDTNGSSSGISVPTDPNYTTLETTGMIGSVGVQLGADVNLLRRDTWRCGIRATGGGSQYVSLFNAEGFEGFGFNAGVMGFYRMIFDDLEVAGFIGFNHVWQALPMNFGMVGVEVDFNDQFGLMLSTSLIRQKYYRIFSNGYEEVALSVRDIGITLVYRY